MLISDKIFKFFQEYGLYILFVGYSLGSRFFQVFIETKGREGVVTCLSFLFLPIAILVFGSIYFFRDRLHLDRETKIVKLLIPISAFLAVWLISWGYGLAINAITSSGESIIFEGKVVYKRILPPGPHSQVGYIVKISNEATDEVDELYINKYDFDRLEIGDFHSEVYTKGGLGIPYRYRW
jgi:hypothetical protein